MLRTSDRSGESADAAERPMRHPPSRERSLGVPSASRTHSLTHRACHTTSPPATSLDASPQSRISHRLPGNVGCGFFKDVALHPQRRHLFSQPRQLGLLRLGALASRRGGGITRRRSHQGPEKIDMNREIARHLRHRQTSHRHQPNGFLLELFAELAPCSGRGHLPLRMYT